MEAYTMDFRDAARVAGKALQEISTLFRDEARIRIA